jgi:hypothetical protein
LLMGGEGPFGFDLDWLVEKCLARQIKIPYVSKGNVDDIPLSFHLKSLFYFEAYLMVCRIKRMRNVRRN